jgi:hypothetical protein
VFLANGRIPELYVTALGTLKYTAVLYFLYLALNLFIKESANVTILITTLNLYERKVKQLVETSSLAISFLRMPNICRKYYPFHTHGASLN